MRSSFKVITLGDQSVGKTSIVEAYMHNKFNPDTEPTLGACFYKKDIVSHGKEWSLEIWDTAGEERYNSLLKLYYKNSDAVILVFSVTSRNSFQRVGAWVKQISQTCERMPCIVLVANKSDLLDQEEVSYQEAKEYADRHPDWEFVYASAKQNRNIQAVFSKALEKLVKRIREKEREVDRKIKKDIELRNKKRRRNSEGGCC